MSLTLTGANFTSDYFPTGSNIDVECKDPGDSGGSGLGVTVENVVVVNSTTITCDFVISQTAQVGRKHVVVADPRIIDGEGATDSGTIDFFVGYPSDFLVFFG